MAKSGDVFNDVIILGGVGLIAYLIYQRALGPCVPDDTRLVCWQYWPWNWQFSLSPGAPGFLPFGAGGTPGGGYPTGTSGGTATGPITTSVNVPPSPNMPGTSGQMMCSDGQGNYAPMQADGTCPTGMTPTLVVNVQQ